MLRAGQSDSPLTLVTKPSLRAHLEIARFDHWVKNVFVLPGMLIAISVETPDWADFAWRAIVGLLSVSLIASSNYIINEILDAPFDRHHPTKQFRPIPAGRVSLPWAYVQWLAFMVAGMALAFRISVPFAATMAALWIMGIVYNVPPIRSKDKPYLDVLSESVNNPLRMLAGWYITRTSAPPPASLLVSYWMGGCYFMAIKRFAEYREIGDAAISAAYRKSFAFYNEPRLLVSIMFYASFAMLTFGAFLVRYRLELVLAFPGIAVVMAIYLRLAFKPDSAAQHPEKLYREPALMASVIFCTIILGVFLFVRIPALYALFSPLKSGLPQ
jgi:decaprenyl-phosphate phosphoribosyltransferase